MNLFDKLDDKNITLYAATQYYNPTCIDADEFYEDYKRFKYIKRLINRYVATGKMKERLILNHLIVIFNVFGTEAGVRMLQYKIDKDQWHILKPFLIYLDAITNTQFSNIPMDNRVVNALREI